MGRPRKIRKPVGRPKKVKNPVGRPEKEWLDETLFALIYKVYIPRPRCICLNSHNVTWKCRKGRHVLAKCQNCGAVFEYVPHLHYWQIYQH